MKLIIEDDEGRRTVIPVVRDEITIGRNEANMVRLTEKNVSRKHGRLVREEGHFYIEDLDSFTGIRVNGEKIKGKHLVEEGDLIQISEYDLSLQASPDEKPKGEKSLADDDEEATLIRKQAEQTAKEDAAAAAAAKAAADAAARKAAEEQAAAEARARKDADTAVIRLSDLPAMAEAEDAVREVSPGMRPKLLGMGGAYRGREMVLDRTPIRLGRSDENDISIDHPSISRKHCRLHLDGGTWKIMDAESRNGVRVNGEPYAAIGLRHGDVLEIGHLKFAFVAPGQSYKLAPERSATPTASAPVAIAVKGGKELAIGVGVGLVVVLVGGISFLTRDRGGGANAKVEEVQDSKAERKFALRSAEESLAAHRYTEALRNLDAARRAGATAAELRNYSDVQGEARGEDLYREMESAASSQDWERARKLLGLLTSGTTYYGGKAAQKADAITAGYVNLHIAAAGLMKGKDNAGCLSEAQLALHANPRSADAQSLVEGCKNPPVVAAAPAPSARSSAPARERPERSVAAAAAAAVSPAAKAGGDNEARRLVNEGNQKLVAQDLAGAIASYQKALATKPSATVLGGVYRSMGIAFTRQGNIEEGAHYYKLYLPLCTNPAEKAQLQKVLADYEARRR